MLARLPHPFREMQRPFDIRNAVTITSIWCAVLLLLAWLAAFRRQNWARWTLLMLFVAVELAQFGGEAYFRLFYPDYALHHTLGSFLQHYVHVHWSSPWAYGIFAVKVALIVLIFSGNARPWFRREETV